MTITTGVLPTYNEAENLPLVINELLKLEIDGLRIVVVDDNSPDGTGKLADDFAMQFPRTISVIHRKQKAGLGAAYLAGFRKALSNGSDYIIQMDCDLSHQPKYIPEMIAAATSNDLVIGSRYVKGGSIEKAWDVLHKLRSWFGTSVCVPTILNIPIHDTTGGYRMWRRQTLLGLDLERIASNAYVFQVETAYMACRLGYKVVEIPVHFPERTHGESKMDLRTQFEAVMHVWNVVKAHSDLNPQMRHSQA